MADDSSTDVSLCEDLMLVVLLGATNEVSDISYQTPSMQICVSLSLRQLPHCQFGTNCGLMQEKSSGCTMYPNVLLDETKQI